MKKRIGLVVVFALVAALSFAQFELSAGGGLMVDASLDNDVTLGPLYYGNAFVAYGAFIFFDATYAEAAITFGPAMRWAYAGPYGYSETETSSTFAMNFSLLGKYPFRLGSSFKLFPMVGFGYNMIFKDSPDFNQFGLLFGAGLDYNFQRWEHLYLRSEVLVSLRFPGKWQRDTADLIPGASTKMGYGAVVKVGVGYKF